MPTIRTRFAPSPTGALHCGTVRTALFAWLLAQRQGQFLLRIEDTDQKREVEGGVDNIKETLRWLGLTWNEGPDVGGPYAPYTQSERLAIYRQCAQELLQKGLAYADPYSAQELEELRQQALSQKRPFLYRNYRPTNPPAWDASQPLRIKLEPKAYQWDDAIMGTVSMGPEMIDDYVIIKADGFPTYNFCHIVDDHLMRVTHILRSQEFLSSIPKFLATHEALGWESPINATVPPVLGETGGTKLSKRKGAKPVLWYRNQGYLPEALINFMASLGWNDGTEQELFNKQELVEKFSLQRVQRSGARFDENRLLWMNGQWIRRLELNDLLERVKNFWPPQAEGAQAAYKQEVLKLVQDRLKTLSELSQLSGFFFAAPTPQPELLNQDKKLAKLSQGQWGELLAEAIKSLEKSDFTPEALQQTLNGLLASTGQKPVILFSLVRYALTWAPFSPGLAETMSLLGKNETMQRLQAAQAAITP